MNQKVESKAEEETKVTPPGKVEAEVTKYPSEVAAFGELLKSSGVVEERIPAILDYCSQEDLRDLQKLDANLWDMGIANVHQRRRIIKYWSRSTGLELPKQLITAYAEQTKATKVKEEEEAEGDKAKYFVDPDTGIIRQAKDKERALTLDEAKELQKLIKKDLAAMEGKDGDKKEPAFVQGEQGAWTLNPNAKIGYGEFAVFQMYQDSLRRGEPIDPVEELTKREEQSVRLREAMGAKTGVDSEMTTLDKLDKLGMLKKGEGEGGLLSQLDSLGLLRKSGEEGRGTQIELLDKLDSLGMLRKSGEEGRGNQIELLDKLDSLGMLRKSGEEGRGTQIELLDKLDSLGMLKKPGEEGEGSQTVRALQTEIKELREAMQKQEMDTLKGAVVSISNQMTELRKEMANTGKLEGRYALLEKAMNTIDGQLSGIRSDAKPLLSAIGQGGGQPRKKSPEEKAKLAKGLKEAVALEQEAKALEDELLFGGSPPS